MELKSILNTPYTLIGILIIIAIIIALMVVFVAAIWVYGFGTMTQQLTNLENDNPTYNISDKMETTFGNINAGLQQLRWISYMIIFGMFLGVIISAFFIRVHPGFFILYISKSESIK